MQIKSNDLFSHIFTKNYPLKVYFMFISFKEGCPSTGADFEGALRKNINYNIENKLFTIGKKTFV